MSEASYKFEKSSRGLMERLFEPPEVGKMSPVAKLVAYAVLFVWSLFVLFPIYWVLITSFKDAAAVNQGPFYLPFVDFMPNTKAWVAQFTEDTNCGIYAIARQFGLHVYNAVVWILSPVVTIQPMEPQICKIYLAFTNSLVISLLSTLLCVTVGSMAAYALARIQYRPKFGNIATFVAIALSVILVSRYLGINWMLASAVGLALFFFLVRAIGKHYTSTLGNNDILFWIISQRILPPIVIIIPVYMMFQAVGLLDSHLGLIIIYAVANLPIELEESAQLDGATRFEIFWDIVLPLTRPGLAATTLLTIILNWNEYLFAVFLATAKAQTMPIIVAAKNAGEKGVLWWEMSAVIVVMIIPVIVMAILLQRFISKGVLMGAVKG